MNLSIEIRSRAAWLTKILEQEGIPFSLQGSQSTNPSTIVADFACRRLDPNVKLLITGHKVLGNLAGVSVKRRKVAYFEFLSGRGHALMDVHTLEMSELENFVEIGSHLGKNEQKLPGSGMVLGVLNGVVILSMPWDMRKFPGSETPWSTYLTMTVESQFQFTEVAPLVDDGYVRKAVVVGLIKAYGVLGLPIARVSPVIPGKGLLAIRIDADGFSSGSTTAVNEVSKNLKVPFSWFIDTWAWRHEGPLLREIGHHNEIGLHSYFHITSFWSGGNERNLENGMKVLGSPTPSNTGFVAPFGHWNSRLRKAIQSTGFAYSSEFAFGVDPLPSVLKGKSSTRYLQIPTVPISLGVWGGPGNYWEALKLELEHRIETTGFAVLYDHPLGRLEHHTVEFESLLRSFTSRGVEIVTMGEIGRRISARPALVGAMWENQQLSYTLLGENLLGFEVESLIASDVAPSVTISRSPLFNNPRLKVKRNVGRTLFFAFLSAIPIPIHLAWAKVRHALMP